MHTDDNAIHLIKTLGNMIDNKGDDGAEIEKLVDIMNRRFAPVIKIAIDTLVYKFKESMDSGEGFEDALLKTIGVAMTFFFVNNYMYGKEVITSDMLVEAGDNIMEGLDFIYEDDKE